MPSSKKIPLSYNQALVNDDWGFAPHVSPHLKVLGDV